MVEVDRAHSGKRKEANSHVVVGAFVLSAIVTPPDVMSQLLLAVPICLLYELGLLLAPVFVRRTQATAQATEVMT